jgi:hypothetical protein
MSSRFNGLRDGCSPRERGWTAMSPRRLRQAGVFSARAGMDRQSSFRSLPLPGVLRASGDGPMLSVSVAS